MVPSRGYRLDVKPYPISLEDVAKTLKHLEEEHELYYLVYRLMLEGASGSRTPCYWLNHSTRGR